jgi:hypothetical protein
MELGESKQEIQQQSEPEVIDLQEYAKSKAGLFLVMVSIKQKRYE